MKEQAKKRLFLFLILGIFTLSILPFVSAQNFLDNAYNTLKDIGIKKFGETPQEIIVGVIVTLIIFAGLYDMLELIGIFQNQWVKYVIAGGVAVIGVIYNIPITIATWGATLASTLGAIGIILEIIIVTIIFIGLIVGSTHAAKFAAKRKGQIEEIKAIKSAGEAKAAIIGLREIQTEFKNP